MRRGREGQWGEVEGGGGDWKERKEKIGEKGREEIGDRCRDRIWERK